MCLAAAAQWPARGILSQSGTGGAWWREFRAIPQSVPALLQDSHAEYREVYPASEGFIAIADRGDGEGLRLICDNGLFFEFVLTDELGGAAPTRHWLGPRGPASITR